ncbi:hypothetical protein ACIJDO_001939 [Enterococcus hirae]
MNTPTSEIVRENDEKAEVTAKIQENIEENFIFDEVIRNTQEMVKTKELTESGESLIAILSNWKEQYIKENSGKLNESKKEQPQQVSRSIKKMIKVMFNKLVRRKKNEDKKEVNLQNNPLERSGVEDDSLIKQKLEEIFILGEVIQETQTKELTESGKSVIEFVTNRKNQLIEQVSNKFNESDKTSGTENPVSSFIHQKLEEKLAVKQFIQEAEEKGNTHTRSMKLIIRLLKNVKADFIKEISEKLVELKKEQSQQALRSMKEVQQVKNTSQKPLPQRVIPSRQQAEPNLKSIR